MIPDELDRRNKKKTPKNKQRQQRVWGGGLKGSVAVELLVSVSGADWGSALLRADVTDSHATDEQIGARALTCRRQA